MKKIIKAFTFIELLVVSSILIIISSSSVFYFFGFIDQSKLNIGINSINEELNLLDKKVKEKDILDYKIFFKKNFLYMYHYENTLDLKNNLLFSGVLNSKTGSGKLFLDPLGINSNGLKLKIYANEKFLKDYLIGGDFKQDYGFYLFKNYKVIGTYSGQILNNIGINYFSEDNLNHKKEDYLKLVNINTNISTNLDSISIKNVLGKKEFSDNSNVLKLTFDVNGKEKVLEIKK